MCTCVVGGGKEMTVCCSTWESVYLVNPGISTLQTNTWKKNPACRLPAGFLLLCCFCAKLPSPSQSVENKKMTWCRITVDRWAEAAGMVVLSWHLMCSMNPSPGKFQAGLARLYCICIWHYRNTTRMLWLVLVHSIEEDSWLICRHFREELQVWIKGGDKKSSLSKTGGHLGDKVWSDVWVVVIEETMPCKALYCSEGKKCWHAAEVQAAGGPIVNVAQGLLNSNITLHL